MRVIPMAVSPSPRRIPRRAQRYQVRWSVTRINDHTQTEAWVVDISCLGARLETPAALAPGLPVKFTVLLPEGPKELTLHGRVVWMRPLLVTPPRFVQGLQFYQPHWDLEPVARRTGVPLG